MQLKKKFRCQYPKCINAYVWSQKEKVDNKHFYRFPKNPDISLQWKITCGIRATAECKSKFVCEDHFKIEQFVNSSKHLLNPNAVPNEVVFDHLMPATENDSVEDHQHFDHNYCFPRNTVDKENECDGFLGLEHNYSQTVNKSLFSTIDENVPKTKNDSDHLILDRSLSESCDVVSNNICTWNKPSDNKNNSIENAVNNKGVLTEAAEFKNEPSPRKNVVNVVPRKTANQLYRLKRSLAQERGKLRKLKKKYQEQVFECINSRLNDTTKSFIDSQLRNVDRPPAGRRWTEVDKSFALSMYKRGPRLYRYLANVFQLPSVRTLKEMSKKLD